MAAAAGALGGCIGPMDSCAASCCLFLPSVITCSFHVSVFFAVFFLQPSVFPPHEQAARACCPEFGGLAGNQGTMAANVSPRKTLRLYD